MQTQAKPYTKPSARPAGSLASTAAASLSKIG